MKVLNKISLVALLFTVGSAAPMFADSLVAGQTITPAPAGGGSFNVLASTGVQSFSFGGASNNKDQGTVEELAVTCTCNPFGANDITFLYQFTVTAGDVSSISGSDFEGFLTDVVTGAGDLPGFSAGTELNASSVSRSPGAGTNVHFDFEPNAVGTTSYVLAISTNATTWDASTIGLIDSGGQTLNGFEPALPPTVPEPSSLLLLGTGVLGMGAAVRRRFSI